MSYFGRVWMAASVAVVQGHTDQGFKWNTGLRSLQFTTKRLSSSESSVDFRPFAGVLSSDFGLFLRGTGGNDKRKQADESLQKAMYLTCWGQS
ncbi:Protein of unknown function wound-induced [Macleaya cordata]|uniref:Uncharacterized protein n=1 Tax=Macleaya cordata TaxID=56857 RepID=A0A200QBY9_MACCD|nr:Protein of unknown function wound-induced [Macleaya cordata]